MNPIETFGDTISANPWVSLLLLVVPGVIQWLVGGRPGGIGGLFAAILASFKPQPSPTPSPGPNPTPSPNPSPNPAPMPLLATVIELLKNLNLLKVNAVSDVEKLRITEAETAIKQTIGPLAIDHCTRCEGHDAAQAR